MPFKSKAQNAWAHTAEGTKALGGPAKVKEWEGATDYSHLPQKLAKGGIVKKAAGLQDHEPPHEPSEGGVNNGHGIFASGGPVRNETVDRHYKTPTRTKLGQFLSKEDRFTSGRMPAGFPQEADTEENWSKPKGVGHTDADDEGDCKSLKPVVPNKAGHVSYAKK